jgi:hypothetical protein
LLKQADPNQFNQDEQLLKAITNQELSEPNNKHRLDGETKDLILTELLMVRVGKDEDE